jgi:hypothetical protein
MTGAETMASLLAPAAPLPPAPLPDTAGLEPLETIRARWPLLLGGGITVLLLLGLLDQLFGAGLKGFETTLPRDPLFYPAFLALYLSLPIGDYLIFRRLWGLPVAGLVPLLKKRVANELVLSYSGEAYFYAWCRQRLRIVSAPFGAIKDVSILSAVAGNLVTLLMLAAATPFAFGLVPHRFVMPVVGSAVIVTGLSLLALTLRRRLFSLPPRELAAVGAIHMARLAAGTILLGLCWHLALPQVALGFWLVLATMRMLVSRLPLIPNKDLLFANLAVLLVGQHDALARLMALTAGLALLLHVVVVALGAAAALVEARR